jgi:hypothetical protein
VFMGTGLLDGSWCAWAGSMDNANTISGLLHGSFSVGAAIGPVLANLLAEIKWYYWYYLLVCLRFSPTHSIASEIYVGVSILH